MKKLSRLLLLLLVLGLALPVSNLFAKPDNRGRLEGLSEEVSSVLESKCVMCHTEGAALPYYASFPVAGGIIESDVTKALRYLDWAEQLPDTEVALAKLERVLEDGSMPPLQYKAMHWDSGIGEDEKTTILAWISKARAERYATGAAADPHQAAGIQPLVAPEGIDADLAALGSKLYHDTRLSGDGTLSCASCHGLDTGGVDRLRFSKGIRDQIGPINAPTVFNAGPIVAQFWDGRAADLAEQAGGPVENPIEMGAEWPKVIETLKQDAELVAVFAKHFEDGLTQANVQKAIAHFEETLVTTDSAFDRWLQGDEGALSAEAKAGYQLFLEHGCQTCHVGKIMGGQSFELMGRAKDYFEERGDVKEVDYGRFNVTKKESDRHKFKVPTLRNVAVTQPYFHDGSTDDLAEAVKTMAWVQNGKRLTDAEAAKMVAFLEALTGAYQGELLK